MDEAGGGSEGAVDVVLELKLNFDISLGVVDIVDEVGGGSEVAVGVVLELK